MERETLEKLYAGLIGMDAGMRLGAPVENPFWTYERLQSYYGDIRGYLREQRYYTADDDVNGPLIFVRALADNAMPETLAPETVGETWLNYTRRGMGMFWWGGEPFSKAFACICHGRSPFPYCQALRLRNSALRFM